MKRLLLIGLLATVLLPLAAQKKERSVEIIYPTDNVYNIFDAMGVKIAHFDLSALRDETYKLSLYIDEYLNGEKLERVFEGYIIGNNWQELPKEADKRKEYIKKKNLDVPRKAKRWHIDEINVYIVPLNDSTSKIVLHTPSATIHKEVHLQTLPEESKPIYDFRPFHKIQLTDQKHQEIPLAVYSSYWFDKEAGMARSCYGDISPDMSDEFFSLTHHYFVPVLILDKREK